MKIVLIRHGQVPGNVDRRYIGRTDELLTEFGRQQAREANPPQVSKVYTSPYLRCVETAQIMYPQLEAVPVDGLREMDFGVFEGRTADEMVDFAPYREWVDGMCQGPVPEGEDLATFNARCCAAFEQIVSECDDADDVALVVHGGTIMAILGAYNDEGREYFEYHVGNCGFYVCECEREPRIVLHRVDGAVPAGMLPPKGDERHQGR